MTNFNVLLLWTIALYFIFLLLSILYKYKQPKSINTIYGYRTPCAMKSIENWNFANTTAANYFLIGTHIILFASLIILYLFRNGFLSFDTSLISTIGVIPVFTVLIVVLFVENKLKKFHKLNKN